MAGTSPAMTQGNSQMTEIRVPTLGESVTEATIGRWFKKAGDAVAVDEPWSNSRPTRSRIEVPAPSAGTLGDIIAKDGETSRSARCSDRSMMARAPPPSRLPASARPRRRADA